MINPDSCQPSTSLTDFEIPTQTQKFVIKSFKNYSKRNLSSNSNSRNFVLRISNCFIHFITFFVAFVSLIPSSVSASTARCYFFGPGMTIMGSDYRKDYGLSQKECANVCKMDSCCMAFEFVQGECTMKARSLNGTISPKKDAVFGLCLDFDDDDRDRFWDHELGGTVLEDKPLMDRNSCTEFCGSVENSVIYSWRTSDSKNMDAKIGHCKCISVLHSIKLSFGSFAGFLI